MLCFLLSPLLARGFVRQHQQKGMAADAVYAHAAGTHGGTYFPYGAAECDLRKFAVLQRRRDLRAQMRMLRRSYLQNLVA